MARRLMSRRGNSASQPQVTPYQQLELDDGWREWENTKQELVLVKRQLTEKDALILQLKTASRRLQETLRKKEKDLQAAFAILRSPQDAKTTKTRKQELIDRLVSECMQRAATSEALAEERRKELDRLKYSSKFLRFQELEVEIEECHTEIDRLRAKLETTAVSSPTAIAGKLKISAVPLVTNVSGSTLVKKNKLEPLNLQEQESPDSRQNMSIPRMSSTQSATGQVRVVPLPKYDHREGFVSKTRRRALEAEYYKQVRLAQLEVECELEENLHIRAAREAKRLEDTERQERRTDFIINSARSQPFTPRNNDPGEEVVQSTDTTNKEIKDIDKANKVPEKSVSEDPAANALEKESENDGRCGEAMEVQREKKTYEDDQNPDVTDDHCKETDYGGAWNVDPKPHNELEPYQNDSNCKESGLGTIWNMDPVSGNKLDPYRNENNSARDDNSKDTNPGSVWNMDPNPESKSDSHQNESKIADFKDSAEDNDEINVKSAAWNVDPEPSSVEAGEEDPDRAIWNTDPNPGDPISPPDDVPVVYSDDDDDVEAEEEQDNSVSSDVNNESTAWNLPISPSLPTEEKPEDPVVSHEVEADSVKEDSNDDDGNDRKEIWNADPTPAPNERHAATNMTENTDVEHLTEVNQPVWNLNPEPAPVLDAVSSSEEIQHTHDDTNDETSPENAGSTAKEIVHADSNSGEDLNAVAGSPSPKTENTDNPWNLEPQVSTSPDSNTDEGQIPDAGELPDRTENVQLKAVHTDIVSDPDTHTVWNLTPSVPESNLDSDGGNEEDNRNSVWNLDPHTGDSSEPPEVIAVSELQTEVAQEDEDASTPRSVGKQLEDSLTEDPKETLAKSSSNYDEGAEAPAAYPSETSNPNSPSEYEDDATPEYTPPSSARDSDDD